ncbi:MAG: phosphatase PAP2 family protein [Butyricicoccaceae bacterium]
MTELFYQKISEPFRVSERRVIWLNRLNRIFTLSVYIAYPLSLIVLFFLRDARLLRCIAVPAVSFVLLSAFRRCVNAKRPYEVLDIQPLIHKDTKGKSFPSRHVFSMFIIAMSFFYLIPALGIVLFVLGILLGAIRVIGGVHFPRDVIAGALIGIICGILGFYLI